MNATVLHYLGSLMGFRLTWSWAMLKFDLTGQSSHVSFSRNILSSSSRALRCWEERERKKGTGTEQKKTRRVKTLKRRSQHLSITDLMPFFIFKQLLIKYADIKKACKGHWCTVKRKCVCVCLCVVWVSGCDVFHSSRQPSWWSPAGSISGLSVWNVRAVLTSTLL